MDDLQLLEGFERRTLTRFSHEDHVRVAYLLIRKYGAQEAPDRVIAGLRGLAKNFGTPAFFLHVTRTVAWVRIIDGVDGVDRVDGKPRASADLLRAHPELHRRDLLDDYYSPFRLLGYRPRRTFVEPDLRPFPRMRSAS